MNTFRIKITNRKTKRKRLKENEKDKTHIKSARECNWRGINERVKSGVANLFHKRAKIKNKKAREPTS
jgi:hypothetical protein